MVGHGSCTRTTRAITNSMGFEAAEDTDEEEIPEGHEVIYFIRFTCGHKDWYTDPGTECMAILRTTGEVCGCTTGTITSRVVAKKKKAIYN